MNKFLSQDAAKLVIVILGVCLIVMILGGGILNFMDRQVPDRYFDIINSIVVGLLALLARSGDPMQVEVTNTKQDPVPTEDAKR